MRTYFLGNRIGSQQRCGHFPLKLLGTTAATFRMARPVQRQFGEYSARLFPESQSSRFKRLGGNVKGRANSIGTAIFEVNAKGEPALRTAHFGNNGLMDKTIFKYGGNHLPITSQFIAQKLNRHRPGGKTISTWKWKFHFYF